MPALSFYVDSAPRCPAVQAAPFSDRVTQALEKWSVELMGNLLPRHLEIIYAINWNFLQEVKARFGDDEEHLRRMSIVEEGFPKTIRMAHLAMVGSHTTNGVAAIHTELLKSAVFPDFYR